MSYYKFSVVVSIREERKIEFVGLWLVGGQGRKTGKLLRSGANILKRGRVFSELCIKI